nr:MAG TPA: SCCmec type IV-encoded binding protein [Bacteriophage sp.]
MIDQSSAFVSGTWMNPATGHKFTVKDCVFENGELLIISTDGQHISGRMFADYVQDTGKDANGQAVPSLGNLSTPVSTPPVIVGDLPVTEESLDAPFGEFSREVSVDISDHSLQDEAAELLQGGASEPRRFNPNLLEGVTHKNMDLEMVTRVLRKHDLPTIETLKWNKPTKQIDTLTDILGIDMDTIVEYYVNRINPEELVSMVKEYLRKELCGDTTLPKPVENGPTSRRTTKKRG